MSNSLLPSGWSLPTLAMVADVSSGIGFPNEFQGNSTGDLPFYKVSDVSFAVKETGGILCRANHYVSYAIAVRLKGRPLRVGTTVFAKIGEAVHLNRRAFVSTPCLVDNNVMAVKARFDSMDRYIHYFLKTVELGEYARSTTVPSLRKGDVEALLLPLAPEAEQTRIANQLDTLLARVQACNDRFDAIPALLKRFRQTVLDAATSGSLTDDWRQSESTSGTQAPAAHQLSSTELPFGWKQYQLRELVDCFDNARIPIKASERAKRQGAFSYYGAFGIIDSIDDFLFDGAYLLLAEDGKNLESRDRPIALIANGKFWVNNHAHVIRPKTALDIRFLLHWLNSKSCDISDLLTGIDQIKLTRGAMDRIPVPLPPATEQTEIVRRVEALFALAGRIEASCTVARTQAHRLTPLVLAKAFRGELVPQDPNDEPASELLARIGLAKTAGAGKNVQKVPVAQKRRAQAGNRL